MFPCVCQDLLVDSIGDLGVSLPGLQLLNMNSHVPGDSETFFLKLILPNAPNGTPDAVSC